MSLSAVNGTLSSLGSCQADIHTGMDIVTDVAMDLSEAQDGGDHPDIKELEAMILECARLDREINYFVDSVRQVTAEVNPQQPETMFGLSDKVKEHFTRTMARLTDADLYKHQKVLAFHEGIKNSSQQENLESTGNMEELGEDIAVTQSLNNFTCPLTQVEMVNPVKNKKCNHQYSREAILDLIRRRHKQNKNCRCPVVGCVNGNVVESDLILDPVLSRRIRNQKKSSSCT